MKAIKTQPYLAAGILQAMNLDFLHPLGLEVTASGEQIEIRDYTGGDPRRTLFSVEQLESPDFLGARIAFLRFQRIQILRRYDLVEAVHQFVPGRYCERCGCTELEACVDGSGRSCGWVKPPDSDTGEPGICSACITPEEEESPEESDRRGRVILV